MEWFETDIRVRYAETDQMGIVHHSNYVIWFEVARSEFCRARGFSYVDMENDAAFMTVAETYCRFKAPANYDELLTIRVKISEMRRRSIRFEYEVFRASDQMALATGNTLHVVTNSQNRVRIVPENYRDLMMGNS